MKSSKTWASCMVYDPNNPQYTREALIKSVQGEPVEP
jgi:hypothetical protein